MLSAAGSAWSRWGNLSASPDRYSRSKRGKDRKEGKRERGGKENGKGSKDERGLESVTAFELLN